MTEQTPTEELAWLKRIDRPGWQREPLTDEDILHLIALARRGVAVEEPGRATGLQPVDQSSNRTPAEELAWLDEVDKDLDRNCILTLSDCQRLSGLARRGVAVEPTPTCGLCLGPLSRNPHPDAGKPETILEVGAEWECIPCQRKALHGSIRRAMDAEARVKTMCFTEASEEWQAEKERLEAELAKCPLHGSRSGHDVEGLYSDSKWDDERFK